MVDTCDVWGNTWNALTGDVSTPTKNCAYICLAVVLTTFVASSLTGNYSQVDKIWSITPFVYCWIVVSDERTLLMAMVSTLWGLRLTWNFSRRGGYRWPPWNGDEDYRWKYLQDATPSVVAHIAVTSCKQTVPLNRFDFVATVMFLSFVLLESLADNEQYKFQTEKHRLRKEGKRLTGEYADGFKQSGLFAIVRKPNYAAEQGVWISFYVYTLGAFNGYIIFNWSLCGCLMLSLLFQGSGWLTEKITIGKYPKYGDYMQAVPLYMPNPLAILGGNVGSKKKN
eukprot:scaffold1080_cov195-Cylindrotheca_fusiformis.AAC.5